MILNNGENSKIIKDYLEKINEDDFINIIIIPLFRKYGYFLLRVVTHGPGEHGKDIIFYRSNPLFFDNEYLVVQAKSQKVTASNVVHFSTQLIRALKTPFKGNSGTNDLHANYVFFINSKGITNDAVWEFPYLSDSKNNIKILNQDNIVNLMINNSIIPKDIESDLYTYDGEIDASIDTKIQNIMFKNNPNEIDNLFDNIISLSKDQISQTVKNMIIEFIFNLWEQDRSWIGTVKPMKWLDKYFDFMIKTQYKYLEKVLNEYASSTPSFEAQGYTMSIIEKIHSDQIIVVEDQYFKVMIDLVLHKKNYSLYDKIRNLKITKKLKPKNKQTIKDIEFIRKHELSDKKENEEYKKIRRELSTRWWE